MGRASDLSIEQRKELVLAVLRREEPISVLSRRYGVAEGTIYKWVDSFLDAGSSALKSKNQRLKTNEIDRLKRELYERDRLIGEITIANNFLKKRLDRSY